MRTLALLTALLLAGPPVAFAQAADSLPAGVTADMIAQGKTLYGGAGLCAACHGPDAKGVKGIGPSLTDAEWLHGDGSFATIVTAVREGVPAAKSSTGMVMPPRGGSQLTDEQVKAVAAYVWSLSHGAPKR